MNPMNMKIQNPLNPAQPLSLRFSPTAWAKLLYFRDQTSNEVGGFGITLPNDLLYVQDFVTVKQKVTCASVRFDDDAVADYFEDQVVLGRKPEQFARIWCHTHPDNFARPSSVDEETFDRVFGACQWAVMFILAQDNQNYARLSFNVGPGGQLMIPVEVDYDYAFQATNMEAWDEEYVRNVIPAYALENDPQTQTEHLSVIPAMVLEELDKLPNDQRVMILEELATKWGLWQEDLEDLFL